METMRSEEWRNCAMQRWEKMGSREVTCDLRSREAPLYRSTYHWDCTSADSGTSTDMS